MSEIGIFDIRLLEEQGALLVVWPQLMTEATFLDSFSIWLIQSSLSSIITPNDFVIVT